MRASLSLIIVIMTSQTTATIEVAEPTLELMISGVKQSATAAATVVTTIPCFV